MTLRTAHTRQDWALHGAVYGLITLSTAIVTIMALRRMGAPTGYEKTILGVSGCTSVIALLGTILSCTRYRWEGSARREMRRAMRQQEKQATEKATRAAAPITSAPPAYSASPARPEYTGPAYAYAQVVPFPGFATAPSPYVPQQPAPLQLMPPTAAATVTATPSAPASPRREID
jgi:hypothetical protein